MQELIPKDKYGIFVDKQDRMWIDSRFVAEIFGKRHDSVLRDIESLDCSDDFKQTNFYSAIYVNQQEKKQPCVHMTYIGFMFLTLGYRGARAAKIKEYLIMDPDALHKSFMDYVEQNGPMGIDEADAETGNPTKYKYVTVDGKKRPEHRVVWEDIFGPLPKGAVIHHKDGDKGNNEIDNLVMFPNTASHVRYHAAHNGYYRVQRKKLRECDKSKSLREQPQELSYTELRFGDRLDRLECEQLTDDLIKRYGDDEEAISEEYNMLDRIVLGMTTYEYCEKFNISYEKIWEHLSEKDADNLAYIQLVDIGLLQLIQDRGEREQVLRNFKENHLDNPSPNELKEHPEYLLADFLRGNPEAAFYV